MPSSVSKISAVGALIAAAIFTSPASADTVSASAELAFQGTVNESTCVFTQSSFAIALPKISKAALGTASEIVGTKDFTVKLSDCPANEKVMLNFGFDQALDAETGRLTVKTDAGDSLELQLMNEAHQNINMSTGDHNPIVTADSDGSAELTYHVGYVGKAGIKAGEYTAKLPVTLAYE